MQQPIPQFQTNKLFCVSLQDALLIRVHGHLTCSINGIILDTWDCSNEKVDKLWIVN